MTRFLSILGYPQNCHQEFFVKLNELVTINSIAMKIETMKVLKIFKKKSLGTCTKKI